MLLSLVSPLTPAPPGSARVTQQFLIEAHDTVLPSVSVSQQFLMEAHFAPRPTTRVSQQYIILAVRNRRVAPRAPQVFG